MAQGHGARYSCESSLFPHLPYHTLPVPCQYSESGFRSTLPVARGQSKSLWGYATYQYSHRGSFLLPPSSSTLPLSKKGYPAVTRTDQPTDSLRNQTGVTDPSHLRNRHSDRRLTRPDH